MTNTHPAETATPVWIASHNEHGTFGTDVLASDPSLGGGATFIAFAGENNGQPVNHSSLNVHNVARVAATITDVSVNGNGNACLTLRIHNGGVLTEVSLFGHDVLVKVQQALANAAVLS